MLEDNQDEEIAKARVEAIAEFKSHMVKFVNEAYELSVAWEKLQWHQTEEEDRANLAYPKYLPSFDEFLFDLFNLRDAVQNTEGWEVTKK